MAIEDAGGPIQAQIDEVFANHLDLRVAVRRTARRLKRVHLRRLIVQERQRGRLRLVAVLLINDPDRNLLRLRPARTHTLDLARIDELGSRFDPVEYAEDVLVFLEFLRENTNVSAASGRALVRSHVVDPRRLVIVVWYVIICVVLVVESEVDASYRNAIEGGGRHARHLRGVDETRRRLHIEVGEDAEGVVLVVDPRLINERVHAAAHEDDLVPAAVRTVVRLELRKDRIAVEPVVDPVLTLLLLVERDAERDRLIGVVGEGSLADQVGGALKLGLHGFGAEVAPQVLVVVEEVLTPDLNDSASIFRAVAGVDRVHASVIIVTERLAIVGVCEVTGQ